MQLTGKNIGFGVTSSFCTVLDILDVVSQLKKRGANVIPIVSREVFHNDSRFHQRDEFLQKLEDMTGNPVVHTIRQAETVGPDQPLDAMVIAPMTGTSAAKLAHGISDTPVLMATKATLRNGRPVVLALFSNDALGANGINVAKLYNTKNIYFVPFGQDDPVKKPTSLTADLCQLESTLVEALQGRQIQPAVIQHSL